MLSVVITTYNRRKFLKEAVFSVVSQDYHDKEIIVVDDGSTDDSYREIQEFPVRYVWKPNGGISSARNCGILISKGDHLAFLDSDDLWLKAKLSMQMELMKRYGSSLSYTDEIWIRNGKRLNQKLRHKKYSGCIFERCLPLCIISPSSVVIKREVFDRVGLFDESMPVCEDYDMWLRITSKYEVLFVEKPLIIKRGGHDDQLSKSLEAMDRFRIESLVKVLGAGDLNIDMKTSAEKELKRKCCIYIKGATRRGNKEEIERIVNLIKKIRVSFQIDPGGHCRQ